MKKRREIRKQLVMILASILLVSLMAVGGTVAYLSTQTQTVENVFQPTNVPVKINEDIENGTKTNVTVQNDGNIDAYIRAKVLVNWVNENDPSIVYGKEQPVLGTDYEIEFPGTTGWFKGGDGFYYYTLRVEPTRETGILLDNCAQLKDAPEGYCLSVEILAQSIQADGMSNVKHVVETVWPVQVNNGTLSQATGGNEG